jgi:hypothetical protein
MAPVVGQKQQFNALGQNGQQRCTRGNFYSLRQIGVFENHKKSARQASTNERIDNVPTGLREIDAVSRSDRQTVDNRCRCDEAILDRHGFSSFAKTRQQFRPFQSGVRIPGKTVEMPGPFRHDSL